jgi:hypothetical protein
VRRGTVQVTYTYGMFEMGVAVPSLWKKFLYRFRHAADKLDTLQLDRHKFAKEFAPQKRERIPLFCTREWSSSSLDQTKQKKTAACCCWLRDKLYDSSTRLRRMLNEEICLPRGLAGFPIAGAPDWSSYQESYTPPSKPASPLGIL